MATGNGNGWMKKIAIGVLIGISIFSTSDFVLGRRASAAADVRQDAELLSLRRDMDRVERALESLDVKMSDGLRMTALILAKMEASKK